ncbi:hypothetical protein LWI29_033681 [Acer saccharum]|uniref:Uncharacterized protein n=1 Tax=Acer saccharum TaxID=4024 RepID=A0AA39W944_ACESA|nr:hypothetical protein LWI29_033681 [Acer saccharum]
MAMIDEPLYPIAVLFDELKNVDLVIVASQSCVAAVSLLCFSYNFRKNGNWRFLLVDRYSGQLATFRNRYIQQIQVFTNVEVVGIILCLHASTKICLSSENIAPFASR